MPTEQQVATVVLAVANGALPSSVRAYEPSKVPETRPAEFVTVALVRRFGGSPRAGRYLPTGWALYVMAASQVSEGNARNSLQKVGDALEGRILVVAGKKTTPITFSNARPIGPDDGWSSGVKTYHFVI